MSKCFKIVIGTLRSSVRSRHELALENLALRQQLATLKHRWPSPYFSPAIKKKAASDGIIVV